MNHDQVGADITEPGATDLNLLKTENQEGQLQAHYGTDCFWVFLVFFFLLAGTDCIIVVQSFAIYFKLWEEICCWLEDGTMLSHTIKHGLLMWMVRKILWRLRSSGWSWELGWSWHSDFYYQNEWNCFTVIEIVCVLKFGHWQI